MFGRRAPSRAGGAADPRRGAALAEPVRRGHRASAGAARAAGLRPRLRRSVLLWRRVDAARADRSGRNGRAFRQPSAFSLAAARLGWALQETALVSLHGRALDRIRPHLQPGARILALTSDGDDAGRPGGAADRARLRPVAAHRAGGDGRPARAHPDSAAARRFDLDGIARAQHGRASKWSRSRARASSPLTPGLADDLFEHDGQITKREIRAMTLVGARARRGRAVVGRRRRLGLRRHRMDACRSFASSAVAVERRCRARRAHPRATPPRFGVPGLQVVEGAAPACARGPGRARTPSSSAAARAAPACSMPPRRAALRRAPRRQRRDARNPEPLCIAAHAARGGELTRIAIARAEPRRALKLAGARHAGDAMGVGEAMIVAGIGCRKGARRARSIAVIDAALAEAGLPGARAVRDRDSRTQGNEPGIAEAAPARGLRVAVVAASRDSKKPTPAHRPRRCVCAQRRAWHRSPRRRRLPAPGPGAQLLVPRIVARTRDLRARRIGAGAMTVHFIGAGPGAPDLITLRGRDLIARCPVCLYAGSLVPQALLAHCPAGRTHRRHRAAVAR